MSWLVVGLGNPGPKYAAHRHNVGYLVGDVLAHRLGSTWKAHKSGRADVIEGHLGLPGSADRHRVVLCRARSYMNETGGPVSTIASFYGIDPDHVIAIHDELDIDFGALRAKFGGGDNGHNGLRSIRQSLDTGDYYRVRVGIGRPHGRQSVHDFVLSAFSPIERKELAINVDEAADAVESIITSGLEATQSTFNR